MSSLTQGGKRLKSSALAAEGGGGKEGIEKKRGEDSTLERKGNCPSRKKKEAGSCARRRGKEEGGRKGEKKEATRCSLLFAHEEMLPLQGKVSGGRKSVCKA